MKLTKKYRLVWKDEKILLYGEYSGGTHTIHNAFECDTQVELDAKVLDLGLEIPQEKPTMENTKA